MATLGEIKQTAYEIAIHCETWADGRFCANFTRPNIDQLIQYLGADFDITERKTEFLRRFVCERCGGRTATMRVTPPRGRNGVMDSGVGSHDHGPMPSAEERARRVAAFEAEFRRMGFRTNAELAAESKALRKAKKLAEKENSVHFIGPPNPWKLRKRGRWL